MIPAVIGSLSSQSSIAAAINNSTITLIGYDSTTASVYVQRTSNGGTSWSSLGIFSATTNAGLASSGTNSGFKTSGGTYGWCNGGGGSSYLETTNNFSTFTVSNSFNAALSNGGFWNGTAYVIGRTTGIVNSTTDFSTFATSTAIGSGNNMKGVAYGGGIWVICGSKSTNGAWVWTNTTTNGSGSWTDASGMTSTNTNVLANHVAYGGGKFVAVGGSDGSSGPYTWQSSNGTSWTANGVADSSANGAEIFYSVATDGNGKWVTCGSNGLIYYSTNAGTSWTKATSGVPTYGSTSLGTIIYSNNMFIATGANNIISYSSDGISWTTKSLSTPSTVTWTTPISG